MVRPCTFIQVNKPLFSFLKHQNNSNFYITNIKLIYFQVLQQGAQKCDHFWFIHILLYNLVPRVLSYPPYGAP